MCSDLSAELIKSRTVLKEGEERMTSLASQVKGLESMVATLDKSARESSARLEVSLLPTLYWAKSCPRGSYT